MELLILPPWYLLHSSTLLLDRSYFLKHSTLVIDANKYLCTGPVLVLVLVDVQRSDKLTTTQHTKHTLIHFLEPDESY